MQVTITLMFKAAAVIRLAVAAKMVVEGMPLHKSSIAFFNLAVLTLVM